MGTTANFLKLRSTAKEIKLNQWHNNFSAVKKFAESKNVPFIAVWSNGDKCGHCIMFEQCLMDSKFKTWMKTSGCAFWFGYYGDTSKDDKYEGTGFLWTYNKGKCTQYPMVRIYWKSGKIDISKNGGLLTGDTSKGAAKLVKNLKSYLKNYKPACDNCEPTPVTPVEPKPEVPVFIAPTLSYDENSDGTARLIVNGADADRISIENAKYIVEKYNK